MNWTVIDADQDYFYIQVPREEWIQFNDVHLNPHAMRLRQLAQHRQVQSRNNNTINNMMNNTTRAAGSTFSTPLPSSHLSQIFSRSGNASASSTSSSGVRVGSSDRSNVSTGVSGNERQSTIPSLFEMLTNNNNGNYRTYSAIYHRTNNQPPVIQTFESGGQMAAETEEEEDTDVEVRQENVDCPVCLEPFTDQPLMRCGHYVCSVCIEKLLSDKCPVCRAKMRGGLCTAEVRRKIAQNEINHRIRTNAEIFNLDQQYVNDLIQSGDNVGGQQGNAINGVSRLLMNMFSNI